MKIALASDLHLEFFSHDDEVFDEFIHEFYNGYEQADVLILAGDITHSRTLLKYNNPTSSKNSEYDHFKKFMSYVSEQYSHILFVLGNHEHWYGTFQSTVELFREFFVTIGDNIHLLEKDILDIDNVRFYGATFWTDYNKDPLLKWNAPNCMNDYRSIKSNHAGGYHRLSIDVVLKDHIEAVKALKKQDDVDVVVSHHAPSEMSVDELYANSDINGLYYSNLEELIMDKQPSLWVHGHMHAPVSYHIMDTHVLSNPCGYHRSEVDVTQYKLEYISVTPKSTPTTKRKL